MRFLLLLSIIGYSSSVCAQTLNRHWSDQLEKEVARFEGCADTSTSCHALIGKVLKTVYQIDDFYSKKEKRYMRVDEIQSFLQASKQWSLLGQGFEQTTLQEAQSLANKKRAVIAIYVNEEKIGHLAYVLPGELSPSGSWGVQVPNSMAYFVNEPSQSYVNRGLSYSFPRRIITDVYLYARKY